MLVIITSGCRLRKVARSLPENGQLAPQVCHKSSSCDYSVLRSVIKSLGPVLLVPLRIPRVLPQSLGKYEIPVLIFISRSLYKCFRYHLTLLCSSFVWLSINLVIITQQTVLPHSLIFLMKVRSSFLTVGRGWGLTRGGLTVKLALCLHRWRPVFIRLNINKQ